MKKVLLFFSLLLLGSCGIKKDIPEELLGKYVQDREPKPHKGDFCGYVILSKNEKEYVIEMVSDFIINGEKRRGKHLKSKGEIDEILFQEELPTINIGAHGKGYYQIKFKNVIIHSSEGMNFKYKPKFNIIKTYELNEKNNTDLIIYDRFFKFTKQPVSILSINGIKFKKIK